MFMFSVHEHSCCPSRTCPFSQVMWSAILPINVLTWCDQDSRLRSSVYKREQADSRAATTPHTTTSCPCRHDNVQVYVQTCMCVQSMVHREILLHLVLQSWSWRNVVDWASICVLLRRQPGIHRQRGTDSVALYSGDSSRSWNISPLN